MEKTALTAQRNARYLKYIKLQLKLKFVFSALSVVGGIFAIVAEFTEITALRWVAFAAAITAIIICIVAIIESTRGCAVYKQIKLEACRIMAQNLAYTELKKDGQLLEVFTDDDLNITLACDRKIIAKIKSNETLELASIETDLFDMICDYFRAICYKMEKTGVSPPDIALCNCDKNKKKPTYIVANGQLVKFKTEKNIFIKYKLL